MPLEQVLCMAAAAKGLDGNIGGEEEKKKEREGHHSHELETGSFQKYDG